MSSNYTRVTQNTPLNHYCRNATNIDGDTFVGIKSELKEDDHLISINFPLGYGISESEEEVREEIINLINILEEYKNSSVNILGITQNSLLKKEHFPIQSYLIVLNYYLNHGYFYTREERYKRGTSGPINWNRTIKQEKPIVQTNGFIYSTYRVRHVNETDKDMITEINKYCVYQSTLKIGWLFNIPVASKHEKAIDVNFSINYLNSILHRTNRDNEKQLYQAMIDILKYENSLSNPKRFEFGTNNFEYIWEKLIEDTFGNESKEHYFPRSKWMLNAGKESMNRALEPDSVMREETDIYVLDGKYYKYGITYNPKHLPHSSSINKQITYGEYIATNKKFQVNRKNGMQVYNAFLMPFNSSDYFTEKNIKSYYSIGEAISEWKDSTEYYQRVKGILIDVKGLMQNNVKPNKNEISKLSKEIRKNLI